MYREKRPYEGAQEYSGRKPIFDHYFCARNFNRLNHCTWLWSSYSGGSFDHHLFNHLIFTTEEVKIVAVGLGVGLVLFAIGYSITAGALKSNVTQTDKRSDENQVVDSQK